MAAKTPSRDTERSFSNNGFNPYWHLRDEFARAYAEYGGCYPFSLIVTEGEWEGESSQIQRKWRIGHAGLPQFWDDEPSDYDPSSFFYASEGESDGGKQALEAFLRLAAGAGAALPARVRDAIMPYLLHDLETGNDPHPPANSLSWWIVFLWWQVDRCLFATASRDSWRDVSYFARGENGRPKYEEFKWCVQWSNPFLACVSAIDRCGLLDLTSTEKIPLRILEPHTTGLQRPRDSEKTCAKPKDAQINIVRNIVKDDPDIPQLAIQKSLKKNNGSGIRAATLTAILDILREEKLYTGPAKVRPTRIDD
jgi:hypothetical protein